MNSPDRPYFLIKTLGCKVNQYEEELMRENLVNIGFVESGEDTPADVYIINSCTVTHKADREVRRLARRFYAINPKAVILIAGCLAETEEDRKTLSELPVSVTLVRNREKKDIPKILSNCFKLPEKPVVGQVGSFQDRDRAFIKIQDGCDNRCAYCKVSLVRGRSISRSEEEILPEIERVIGKGFKEIVLTGVCLGSWGEDLPEQKGIVHIVKKVADIDKDFRVRLSSIEPKYVTDELIGLIGTHPRICKHLHVPIQNGDDTILKTMNRKYTSGDMLALLERIRRGVPGIAVSTDIITGFPGEDQGTFRNTFEFLKKARPMRMHIFTYSERPGTSAAGSKKLPSSVSVAMWQKELGKLSRALAAEYASSLLGTTARVLIESERDSHTKKLAGYTDTYVRVFIDADDSLKNLIVPVKITNVTGDLVSGIMA